MMPKIMAEPIITLEPGAMEILTRCVSQYHLSTVYGSACGLWRREAHPTLLPL